MERVIGETTRVERTVQLVEGEFGVEEPLVAAVTHAGQRGQVAATRLEELLAGNGAAVEIRFSLPLGPVLCAHTGFDVWDRCLPPPPFGGGRALKTPHLRLAI